MTKRVSYDYMAERADRLRADLADLRSLGIHDGRDDQALDRIIALVDRLGSGAYGLPANAVASLKHLSMEEMATTAERVITLLLRTYMCEAAREIMWMGEQEPGVHALKNILTHRTALFDEATAQLSIGCGPFRGAQDGFAVLSEMRK